MCDWFFRWGYVLPSVRAERHGCALVYLSEELFNSHRRMGRTSRPEDVEGVLGERQLGVNDGLVADLAEPRGEAARLFDRDQ